MSVKYYCPFCDSKDVEFESYSSLCRNYDKFRCSSCGEQVERQELKARYAV